MRTRKSPAGKGLGVLISLDTLPVIHCKHCKHSSSLPIVLLADSTTSFIYPPTPFRLGFRTQCLFVGKYFSDKLFVWENHQRSPSPNKSRSSLRGKKGLGRESSTPSPPIFFRWVRHLWGCSRVVSPTATVWGALRGIYDHSTGQKGLSLVAYRSLHGG